MEIENTTFGSITVDGKTYEHDVLIDGFRIEVGVRDPRELERRFGRIRHVYGINQRPPSERLSDCGCSRHARSVDECPSRDSQFRIGTQPGLLQRRS